MKIVVALSLLLTQFSFAKQIVVPNDLIRIEIGDDDDDRGRASSLDRLREQNRELKRRVQRLERAVRQLQDRVYSLEDASIKPHNSFGMGQYTCYIETPFNGTIYGKSESETEARAMALKACHEANGGIACTERKLRCGK